MFMSARASTLPNAGQRPIPVSRSSGQSRTRPQTPRFMWPQASTPTAARTIHAIAILAILPLPASSTSASPCTAATPRIGVSAIPRSILPSSTAATGCRGLWSSTRKPTGSRLPASTWMVSLCAMASCAGPARATTMPPLPLAAASRPSTPISPCATSVSRTTTRSAAAPPRPMAAALPAEGCRFGARRPQPRWRTSSSSTTRLKAGAVSCAAAMRWAAASSLFWPQ
jgi:hypothetical protein